MSGSALRQTACGLAVAAVVGGGAGASLSAQEHVLSIRQHLNEAGRYERIVVPVERELQLANLVGQADIIVEASTTGGRARLADSGADIYTDYVFTIKSVFKNVGLPALRPGHALTVRRDSGEIVVDGRTAVVHESAFPPFAPEERYLLFLRPRDQVYVVVGDAQGAFRAGDAITAIGMPLTDVGPLPSTPRSAFMGEMRALLRFTEQ